MISTAPQTIMNASRVPILTSSARMFRGSKAASVPTNTPVRMVDFQGVRNRGWIAAKKLGGTRPSRAIASRTRGWLSIITRRTDVIPVMAPDCDQELRPGQTDLGEGVGDRSIVIDLVVADHAG